MEVEKFNYDNKIVKYFAYATIIWGITGMLVGLIVALQLAFPQFFNDYLGFKVLSFGRIRPLHTNAVIFAFVGNGIFTGVYYSLQRLLKTRMWSDKLSYINFWGWQLIILSAVLTLPLGITSSKEYAELEWPIDIAITVLWVVFGWNMFATILVRRVKHLYVAIWFYIGTFVAVAILHIFNSFELPVSFLKSYSWYAGVQDALVQWWYGHNAVAFFLTTPYLGLMYYFVPKAAERPVYSYRLSIIHFWALIFIYIWAGPHHLLYSSLPDWAQSLGVVFSVMLIAPSWGGMLNGLLTLRGAWDKVRDNVTLKFMVVALTCYGMVTFEGPLLSLKNVNMLSHFTDWTIAHVHVGGLGWNGMLTFGMLYWLFPKMFRTELYSKKMANQHFWIATLGVILYAIPMYVAGFVQGLMWQDFTPEGTLVNGDFLKTVEALRPYYVLRSIGGLLFIVGTVMMFYNLIKTARQGSFQAEEPAEATVTKNLKVSSKGEYWHRRIERKPVQFMILSIIVVAIGGIIEIVPTMVVKSNVKTISSVKPYTPLELEGRDIYIREGCYNCHSQMIRPLRFETVRYGEYSKAGEFVYDHPFQWGSKRTGPDLAREGGLRSNLWHYEHMIRPKDVSEGSIMPAYPWMRTDDLDISLTAKKIEAMQKLNVPYKDGYANQAVADLKKQARTIAEDIVNNFEPEVLKNVNKEDLIKDIEKKEIVAVIAYLQRLGTDIKASDVPK
ncbi:cytochrome-c oxidase, cbb3-type subunit I [Crocinitomicaceae bacterium CZZ-1]|uniref:cytochrome-c oxidase n=1 Tax=Taishania pollutisoli TaxID=2766479 RepID=A0A8J6TTE7_9FLAO|nr:cytochrome-c oxidase, cbb3-type subunit I [Taishania pollutisoli]MBC9812714.1 cytochrome-c oxidase, cbb3-type subunit I [Taishania pollutisoli]NGF75938.1 cytochrome-c oxidase, cbb3-type subunit I [Fluviicola sp. SGL-29]